MRNYDDIINLPHHTSKTHPRMSKEARAAQFGAFRALDGHEEMIEETARLTEDKLQLSENKIDILNSKLNLLYTKLGENPEVSICYFTPDEFKSGGEYKFYKGKIKKIDLYMRTIVIDNYKSIPIDAIYDIQSDIFEKADV